MSVRSSHPIDISEHIAANPPMMESDAMELGEGATGFQGSNRNHPLNRKVVVAVRATLADLSTNAGKAVWSPSSEALKGIYQYASRLLQPPAPRKPLNPPYPTCPLLCPQAETVYRSRRRGCGAWRPKVRRSPRR